MQGLDNVRFKTFGKGGRRLRCSELVCERHGMQYVTHCTKAITFRGMLKTQSHA